MDKNQVDRLLRVQEVADRLGLRVATIRAWILHRRIPAVRVGRRAIRIQLSAVERVIQQGRIPEREARR
jgi:excisionase family DNA binding protein